MSSITSLYAFAIHTGAIRWSVTTNERAIDGSLLVVNNVLYSVYRNGAMNALHALNAQTGQLLWYAQLQLGLLSRLDVLHDHLFIGTESFDQNPVSLLHAFNLSTHKEDWYADISKDAQYDGWIVIGV